MYSQHMYDFMAMECHGYPCSSCSKKIFKTYNTEMGARDDVPQLQLNPDDLTTQSPLEAWQFAGGVGVHVPTYSQHTVN